MTSLLPSSVMVVVSLLLWTLPGTTHAFAPSQQASCRRRIGARSNWIQPRVQTLSSLSNALGDTEDEEDDDDDEYIDTDSLGDWRQFRRSLAVVEDESTSTESKEKGAAPTTKSVSTENEEVLMSQNKKLGREYLSGVWAHQTATPEVGGLVVRMPLEVELYRNHKRSLMGQRLQELLQETGDEPNKKVDIGVWYARAKTMIETEMHQVASRADQSGQIDPTALDRHLAELLVLFLENQETWQEVCLVMEQPPQSSTTAAVTRTLVLNRPMSFKLTENVARLVYFGSGTGETTADQRKSLIRFLSAFAMECAVYIGGPDEQGNPATVLHGIADLPGAVEISPGAQIYKGGLEAAISGVLEGKYNPLEFRFFVGCHAYEESALEVAVHLGKYQPVACARSVALKQCISLPKPLWNEVLELCGGEMVDLSQLELMQRDDIKFQVVDDDNLPDSDDEGDAY